MLYLILCASGILCYCARWWWRVRKQFDLASKFQQPPGFQSHPIFGHAKHFKNPKDHLELFKSFTSPCGVVYLGVEPHFFLNDANMVEEAVTNSQCINKPHFSDHLTFIRNGLFVVRDDAWRKHRKIMLPAFNLRIIHYYESISLHREHLVKELISKRGEVDVFPIIKKFLFVHFFECTLGVDGSGWFEKYIPLSESLFHRACEHMGAIFPNFSFWSQSSERKDTKMLYQYINEIISERYLKRKNEDDCGNNSIKAGTSILLDYLIDCCEHGKLSRQELVEEVITFFFAAMDTSLRTLSAFVVCLGIYPEIQEKAYQEVCEVLHEKSFEPSDYSKLPYLQMVLKETMRLCPVVAAVPRMTTGDVKIGNYIFPKDSILQLNLVNMHYNPKYFENPTEFIPERFASDQGHIRSRYAYIPFLAGIRHCPGEYFAKQLIIGTIATLLQHCRFESKFKSLKDVRMVFNFFLSFDEGYYVKIYPRK